MKIIIAGGRDFDNYKLLKEKCDFYLSKVNVECIISGCARGADNLGERYADDRNYEIVRMPANWDKFGKSAGYHRNEEMAKIGDGLIAFWDQASRGTKHMIDLAKRYNLKTRIVFY